MVALDLNFAKGEMKGMDALVKIKANNQYLPVNMLADSNKAADIDRIVGKLPLYSPFIN